MAEETIFKQALARQRGFSPMNEQGVLSERELLARIRAGSKDAFRLIVTRHMKSAYYVALGLLRNQQDALDVSQQAFIRAFQKRKSFNPERPFFPWFYRLLRNLCIDHIRKCKRRDEIPLEDIKIVDRKKDDVDLKHLMWKSIDELSFEQREVIILRYFRQMSYEEIAETMGRPLGTIMSSLFYAKKKLRVVLKKYMVVE